MIKIEIELEKCRERTKDPAVILLMMEAKADVLDELTAIDSIRHRRDELQHWVLTRKLELRERATTRELVRA